MLGRLRTRCFVAAIGAGIVACGAPAESTPPAPPSVYLAFAQDFAAFRSWPSLALTIDVAPGNDHLSGPRTVFINQRPPTGRAPFPVGTIVVKESGDGDLTTRHVFAMVKRGGDFNATGALDWEWFELQNGVDGSVAIVWRGVGPANGDAYGGDATGGCNTCHRSAASEDYIFTEELAPLLTP